MENKEQVCSYALSRIFSYEPRIAHAIVEQLGDAAGIFSFDRDSLFELLGPFNRYRDAITSFSLDEAAADLARLAGEGYRYLHSGHPDFPEALSVCEDAPVGFFVRSEDSFGNIFGREAISVVGTRDMSSYGKEWCRRVVTALGGTRQRPTIVSGLALGVDITAHLAALENGLPTIAVLGNGAGMIYPACHSDYAERIIHTPCSAVITEYPPGACVSPVNFLCRNRIIAGLSKATVLVESRLRGGGMTTARQASSYGRDVFTVPGRNDDVRSQGCNLLIQAQLASPVIDAASFVRALGYSADAGCAAGRARPDISGMRAMTGVEIDMAGRLLSAIRSKRDVTVTELSSMTGVQYGCLMAILGRLEADGMINIDMLQRCSINTR